MIRGRASVLVGMAVFGTGRAVFGRGKEHGDRRRYGARNGKGAQGLVSATMAGRLLVRRGVMLALLVEPSPTWPGLRSPC